MRKSRKAKLWAATVAAYEDNPNAPLSEIVGKVEDRLVGFGWEAIAIQLAIAVISKLIAKWLEKRIIKAPAMPADFGSELDGNEAT